MMSSTSPERCEAFSRSAEIYDLVHAGKDYDGEAARVLELLGPIGSNNHLADWGAGTGEFTRRFEAAGWTTAGIDSCLRMAAIGSKKGVVIQHGSMTESGLFGDGCFAAQTCLFAAFSYASASHPPLLILENFRRAAAPGGKLVFDFVNADAEMRESQRRMVDFEREVPSSICGTVKRRGCIGVYQKKRLVDMRLIENRVQYSLVETGDSITDAWHELHYLRTFTAREMAELITRAGWKLEKFVNIQDGTAAERAAPGHRYYLTAVCSLPSPQATPRAA